MRRPASVEACARCGRRILVGDDAERISGTAHVDPIALDPLGELLALLAGRQTYTLRHGALGYVIDYRCHLDISAESPADIKGRDVVAEHRCGQFLPSKAPNVPMRPSTVNALPIDPPF